MTAMQTVEAYYTVYYGFGRYRYNSKPPTISRRKVARKLGIPVKNIDIGIAGNYKMWSPPNKAFIRLLLQVGQIMLKLDRARRR